MNAKANLPVVLGALLGMALLVPGLEAQVVRKRTPTWGGDPVRLVCGLNNGLRKILLTVDAPTSRPPSCRLQFRATDDRLDKEIFVDWLNVGPEKLEFQGTLKIDADGNSWDEHRFGNESLGLQLAVCWPVRSIGSKWLEHFRKNHFDFDADHLHFVMVVTRTKENEVPYPLRDLSGFADPGAALLDDLAPMERSAPRAGLVAFLARKLGHEQPERRARALAQLSLLPREELAEAVPALLAARRDTSPEVSSIAVRLCRDRHLHDESEIGAALDDLSSAEEKRVRAALLLLRDTGKFAGARARGRLSEMLETKRIAESLMPLAREALAAIGA